jgi:methionyl-tRNA formyltransferase
MDSGVDTGPILSQREVAISPQDTTGSLEDRLATIGSQLLIETLPLWLEGKLTPRPQDKEGASYSKLIVKEEGEIDWSLSAVDLWRRVRAFQPWPGCYTWWRGRRLKIIEVVPLSGGKGVGVGQVVALKGPQAVAGVRCGEGVLGVRQVQLEGKRFMSAEEFLRGQKDFIGTKLG